MDDVAKMQYCTEHQCWYKDECLACFYQEQMVNLLAERHKMTNKIQNICIATTVVIVFAGLAFIRMC